MDERKIIILSGGPSMKNGIEVIKQMGRENIPHEIAVVDYALIPFLKGTGITPDYITCLEEPKWYTKFFDDPIVREKCEGVKTIVSERVHPDVLKLMTDCGMEMGLKFTDKREPILILNVGTFSIMALGALFNIKDFILLGFDFSYPGGMKLKNIPLDSELFRKAFFLHYNPYTGMDNVANPIMQAWWEQLDRHMRLNPSIKIVNCSGDGIVFGEFIEWHKNLRVYLEKEDGKV